jgi:putative phosphoribosyl transferase
VFVDRIDAGQKLARALQKFRDDRPLILALPRGGVVIGAEVARVLRCDLDVLLVKKLRAPDNPELAIGAICEEGRRFVNEEVAGVTGADEAYLQSESKQRLHEMTAQKQLYRPVRPRISPAGRTVILVDDGLATGATMIAAAQAVSVAKPAKLIVAVPVSPPDTLEKIERLEQVNEVVCLETPAWFTGVGQFYEDFRQVVDEEVVELLKECG